MGDDFKHYLVGWDKVCTTRLGIKKLTTFMKLSWGSDWWFGVEEISLWRCVVTSKFWGVVEEGKFEVSQGHPWLWSLEEY